jgi:anti-anti-sigma regulatory factor
VNDLVPVFPLGPRQSASRPHVGVRPAGVDVQVIVVRGGLSARSGQHLNAAMREALRHTPVGVVVDLHRVDRVDGDGARLLILMRRHARRLSATLPVAGADPIVARALRDVDAAGVLEFYPTVAEASEDTRRRGRRMRRSRTPVSRAPVGSRGAAYPARV